MEETAIQNNLCNKDIEGNSRKYKNWISVLARNTCLECIFRHGMIFPINFDTSSIIPAHENGQCYVAPMRTMSVGNATSLGMAGADAYLFFYGKLPNYYIKKKDAEKHGWMRKKGNLNDVLPGKMIGGDIYKNYDMKLPSTPGRVWYEADINYRSGFRNHSRVLYSSDGLIFISYDHYHTFYEITP